MPAVRWHALSETIRVSTRLYVLCNNRGWKKLKSGRSSTCSLKTHSSSHSLLLKRTLHFRYVPLENKKTLEASCNNFLLERENNCARARVMGRGETTIMIITSILYNTGAAHDKYVRTYNNNIIARTKHFITTAFAHCTYPLSVEYARSRTRCAYIDDDDDDDGGSKSRGESPVAPRFVLPYMYKYTSYVYKK